MPLLRKAELLPVKGIDLSIPESFLPDGFAFPQNLQYYRGEMRKREGRTVLGGVTLGAQKVLHLDTFILSTGNIRALRFTKKNIQQYNTTTGAWDDITGLNDLTGSETDFFSSCVVPESDLFLFTNRRIDNIRKIVDGSNTQSISSTQKCSFLEYITPYVLQAYTTEGGNDFPTKVKWSDTGQPEVFTGGNSGAQLLSDDPSFIRGMKKLRNYAMIYKELSVYRAVKASNSSIFDIQPFSSGKGLYSPRAIASDGENHYYMGLNDFHLNNGVRVVDIGRPVREYIFNRLNRSLNETCHAIHVEQYKEVWFYVTVSGLSWPTEVWKYNYEKDFWYFDTCANIICASSYKQVSSFAWADAVGSWDSQNTFWDDQQGGASAPRFIFGDDNGLVSQADINVTNDLGVAVNARLETKDYTGIVHNGIEYETRFLQFDLWARGDSAKFYYSLDYGSTWVFVSEKTLTDQIEKTTFWFDVIAKHIRFRIVQDGKSKDLLIRSFQPYFLSAGEIWK